MSKYLDQIAKLHQAIYEEWYFKKMIELGDATSKMKNVKDTRKISQVCKKLYTRIMWKINKNIMFTGDIIMFLK